MSSLNRSVRDGNLPLQYSLISSEEASTSVSTRKIYDEKHIVTQNDSTTKGHAVTKRNPHQTLPTVEPRSSTRSQAHPSPPTGQSTVQASRLKTYLTTNITPDSRITLFLLLSLGLATGINDAATFIDYHLFVSNQTGNTIFLGIGALTSDTVFNVRHVAVSLGLFLAGGLVAGQISTYVAGKRARWWVVLSNALQTVCTFAAAALRHWYAVVDGAGPDAGIPRSYSVVAVLAFASGLQVAMARGLGVAEIPTGIITSTWVDLVANEKVWLVWRRDGPRDRRLAFVLCILVGGFVGAAASVYCASALALLLTAVIKAVVTVGFAVDKGDGLVDETEGAPKEKREGAVEEIAK